MISDSYGDAKNPILILLHGAAALDTFSHQCDMLAARFPALRDGQNETGKAPLK